MTNTPAILLIDSYDSFTFNLSKLIENVTGATVVTIHNNCVLDKDELVNEILPYFDAVVVGPGPGSPGNPADTGVLPWLWELSDRNVLPIFGVCLGFQSMVLECGGSVERLKRVKHGQLGLIQHKGDSIFQRIDKPFNAVRYHSLHAIITKACVDIEPLAWTTDEVENSQFSILMAGKHTSKPFYGVQYHPESICSEEGATVLLNFWKIAQNWSLKNKRITKKDQLKFQNVINSYSIKPNPLKYSNNMGNNKNNNNTTSVSQPRGSIAYEVLTTTNLHKVNSSLAVDICDHLSINGQKYVLLNSASEPGRWSIIGFLEPGKTTMLTHYPAYQSDHIFIQRYGEELKLKSRVELDNEGVWGYLARYMSPKLANFKGSRHGPPDAGFIGGLIGFLGYKVGQKYPEQELKRQEQIMAPDVSLVDIERSILLDTKTDNIYIVSIKDDDDKWVQDTTKSAEQFLNTAVLTKTPIPDRLSEYFLNDDIKVELPDRQVYVDKINKAKEYLFSGDSYELCLTAQTRIILPKPLDDPWKLYKILHKRNPSPYSCYMDFVDSTLIGSSPERFMHWTQSGTCEFRPIKGTVKKGPNMTRERANEILNTDKERGENLMIVDLIRHDLNQLLKNVRVEKLMTVEEYHTVYQLVSVICGELPPAYKGLDLLAHSLPPGSMTGAPKIRSVDILDGLEDYIPRGIYSGVSGYWSVLDEGQWSVIIRSAFSYKAEPNIWRIGAGGAITVLSDANDEWDEMKAKLESALQAFIK